jgi:hypothetical protein
MRFISLLLENRTASKLDVYFVFSFSLVLNSFESAAKPIYKSNDVLKITYLLFMVSRYPKSSSQELVKLTNSSFHTSLLSWLVS